VHTFGSVPIRHNLSRKLTPREKPAPDGGPGPGVHCIIGLTHWQGLTQIHPTVQYYTQQRRESLKCMNILLLTPVPQPRLDRLPEIAHFLCALGYVYQNRNVYCSTILVPVNRLATAKPCVTPVERVILRMSGDW
jgi:hypothetical protein